MRVLFRVMGHLVHKKKKLVRGPVVPFEKCVWVDSPEPVLEDGPDVGVLPEIVSIECYSTVIRGGKTPPTSRKVCTYVFISSLHFLFVSVGSYWQKTYPLPLFDSCRGLACSFN